MNTQNDDLTQSLQELSNFLSRPTLEKAVGQDHSALVRGQCARWQDRLRFPSLLHVLVKGNKRAGKSTLLNALLEADYLPATARAECTALPVSIHKADDFRLEIVGKPVPLDPLRAILPPDAEILGDTDRLTIRRAGASADPTWISTLIERLGTTRANSSVLDLLQTEHELRTWLPKISVNENIVFIDTPGTDSNNHKREQASNRQYALAAAFILVINWQQAPGLEFYRSVRTALGKRTDRPILVIITNSDLAKTDDEKEGLNNVRNEVQVTLRQNGFSNISITEVSAKNARICQRLIDGQIDIKYILKDEYNPLSKAETASLGTDVAKWQNSLAKSGNLREIYSWLSIQSNKPRTFGWIAQEAINAVRDVQSRLELHVNVEIHKKRIAKAELSDKILRANWRLSNELRTLSEKKEVILSEFKMTIKSIRSNISVNPKTNNESVYYSDESTGKIFSQIITFCQDTEVQKKLKKKNTTDADEYTNHLISGYVNSEEARIKEAYEACTDKLRREVEKLAKEAWEKSSLSATVEKISPEVSTPIAGKIIGGLLGGAGVIAGVIIFAPLIVVGAVVFGLGWLYDNRLNPGDEYSANAIEKITDLLRKRKQSIDKQLEQAESEVADNANKYFSDQIHQIQKQQEALDRQLNEPEATSQELSEYKIDLSKAEELIKRLSELNKQLSV